MRRPRDFDSELKALNERTRVLQERKLRQLGELVQGTGADELPIEQLAGMLLTAAQADAATKEAWRRGGAAFFQRAQRGRRIAAESAGGGASDSSGASPAAGGAGAQ